MAHPVRWLPAILALLALGAVGLLLERRAGAGDGPGGAAASPPLPTTWVYDVRVVRVDPTTSATVEAAPAWQPSGATGATTKAPWADLLTGLKARGKTTILLDQRLTTMDREKTEFRQNRMRPVLNLRNRQDKTELWDSSYIETGVRGDLLPSSNEFAYHVDVRWEDAPPGDASPPVGSASWSGAHASLGAGETLVLPYRQQAAAGPTGAPELEIYVLVTGWPVPPK